MPKKANESLLTKTHAIMLQYQEEHYQQAADIRWLMAPLGLSSTSVVAYRLQRLVQRGLAVRVGVHYVAIPGKNVI